MTAKNAKDALGVLGSSGLSFDLVITEVHMPEMNGFQLQQEIAKEFDILVAFLSADEKESTTMKGLESGVISFMVKPISQNEIHYLWKYATLRKKNHTCKQVVNQEIQENTNEKILNEVIYIESSSSDSERDKSARKYDDTEIEHSSSPPSKKSRVVWTNALHNKFLEAVTKLGIKTAYPRKILELMDTPELTRPHIASHLQKYRMSLEKETSQELVSNSSEVTFGNANQNLNSGDHDQDLQSYQKDKELAMILCRHINQNPHH